MCRFVFSDVMDVCSYHLNSQSLDVAATDSRLWVFTVVHVAPRK